jgi:threonine/homoserine/homoserine lactone efflux protein
MLWGVHSSFEAMKLPESAGIGSVVSGLQFAVLSIILLIAGIALMIFGGIRMHRDSKKKRQELSNESVPGTQ